MTAKRNAIRCVMGMIGTDVHTKGIRTLSRLLSDAGFDVVYAGEHNTVPKMIEWVRESEPEFVGLSFSTAGYLTTMRQFMDGLRAAGLDDVTVIVGGLIHPEDEAELRDMGVAGAFGPNSSADAAITFMREMSERRTYNASNLPTS